MFNNDFFELKKALEVVTLEVTDLKNQLHKKDNEIKRLKSNSGSNEIYNLTKNINNLQNRLVERDIQIK